MSQNDNRNQGRSSHGRDSAEDRPSYHNERRRYDGHQYQQHGRPHHKKPTPSHYNPYHHGDFRTDRASDFQPQPSGMFPMNQPYAFHEQGSHMAQPPPPHVISNQHLIPPFQNYSIPQPSVPPFMVPTQMFPLPDQFISNPLATGYPPPISGEHLSASALDRLQLPPEKITESGIIPDKPYYQLPAGLMVPLVPPNETEYKPIDPSKLRLPFPKFPDENFLKTIDSFYKDTGKSRDNDGWDQKFIDTYRKQKEALSMI